MAGTLETADALLALCRRAGLHVSVAESCTGGMAAAAITAVAGASDILDYGFVTYSNAAKTALLGVPEAMLEAYGAVSEEVARAMAEGALRKAGADLSVAITGIAGPGGGTAEKPVGLVYIAVATREKTHCARHIFPGDRAQVRAASTAHALAMLHDTACQLAENKR